MITSPKTSATKRSLALGKDNEAEARYATKLPFADLQFVHLDVTGVLLSYPTTNLPHGEIESTYIFMLCKNYFEIIECLEISSD